MEEYEVKYDVAIDLETDNSVKLINERLRDNSEILEFGPANGRLTKYLKEVRNCQVDIVEYNPVSGKDAANYARTALLGPEEGNAESFRWKEAFKDNKYDFIIFADVLEHLHVPQKVLHECSAFLKENGAILVSVPNIANDNIILGLLENEFNYTSTGLLDDTHIKFFTLKSFTRMAEEIGLKASYIDATIGLPGQTEVKVSDWQKKAMRVLAENHPYGGCYQWVFELKKAADVKMCEGDYLTRFGLKAGVLYSCSAFPFADGQYDGGNIQYPKDENYENGVYKARFDLTGLHTAGRFRFDPLEGAASKVRMLSVRTDVENWHIEALNAACTSGNDFLFTTDDPILEVVGNFEGATYIEFEYMICELKAVELNEAFCKLQQNLMQAKADTAHTQEVLCQTQQILGQKEQWLEQKDQELTAAYRMLEAIKSTKGYRALEKLRKVLN